ncbi:LacI family DNA-binding transcriptional regulator [Sporosarcina sp. HYO08]|uniref:LacI family DNA-binding transcriptional regulator n=1 Tax=Sporosarcina sp. HYO08 TaxID=1759557 RepID=UPI00079784FD|nr:LacI family DNA-binding transcriptional regulator [Sporosarcina sp. HYO08]KXH78778.1 transcriptional regulator [Sporosarcina sp. HYO08]
MVSIRDVAKHASVSVATVSRVLNDKGYVSVETRKKVEAAIAELNYRPNEVARSLFKKQSKTLGLILPDIMNPFFPELARAIEDTAAKLGYTVILCNSDEDEEKAQRYLDILLQKYVDGIILASNTIREKTIRELNIPVVCIDREISKDIPTIVVDNKKGARTATQFLKDKGRKRIAHIRGPFDVSNANERCEGYLGIVSSEDWFTESYIINGNYHMETATKVALALLQSHPEVDGIFAANDTMAIGAMKAAYQHGLKVPEDISIIGFDGIALAKASIPELTTIEQPLYALGQKAAKVLIQLIEGQEIEKSFHQFDVQLVEREST